MRSQQPLYICTTQLNIFEKKDAFQPISPDLSPLIKICLTLHINFWLSSPRFAFFYPIFSPFFWVGLCLAALDNFFNTGLLSHRGVSFLEKTIKISNSRPI